MEEPLLLNHVELLGQLPSKLFVMYGLFFKKGRLKSHKANLHFPPLTSNLEGFCFIMYLCLMDIVLLLLWEDFRENCYEGKRDWVMC